MENTEKILPNFSVSKTDKLQQYILETSVYPRESEHLKGLRDATASHPWSFVAVSPDAAQLMGLLLKMLKAKKTIEIGVFTGYSLLLTALSIPDDAKITAIDPDRETYEIGLPFIEKAGVAHKINFIDALALPILDQLLEDKENEGSFDFAFVDADKENYWNYHERLMKLIKVDGMVIYDNTLWAGTVVLPEEEVPQFRIDGRNSILEFNKKIAADSRVEIAISASGDGFTICRRL